MLFPSILFIIAIQAAAALQHSHGDANGIYLHSFNSAGNLITSYLGPPNRTKVASHLRERQLEHSLGVMKRAKKPQGPTGQNGPNCSCDKDNQNCINGDDVDYLDAESQLSVACDLVTGFIHAMSSVVLGSVAYVCDYGNGNRCDSQSETHFNAEIDLKCQNNTAGWYTIKNYLFATGRTNVGVQFCF